VLRQNNRFDHEYAHCTGVEIGKGTYKKGLLKLNFKFDSLANLNETTVKTYNRNSNFITVKILSVYDRSQIDYCSLKHNHISYFNQPDTSYVFMSNTDSI